MSTHALKANGTLLHRQLFLVLRQDILHGRYRAGDRLPTQEALCARFSVSRITVRRALADLQAEGLLRNEQGVGAFVTHRAPSRPTPPSLGLLDAVRHAPEPITEETVAWRTEPATVHVAERLDLTPGADLLYVARLRRSDGQPVLYTEAWLMPRFDALVTPAALARSTLAALIGQDPSTVGRVVDELNAEAADPVVASVLEVEPNSPILRRERIIHDVGERPVAWLETRSSGLRSRLLLEPGGLEEASPRSGLLVHDLGRPAIEVDVGTAAVGGMGAGGAARDGVPPVDASLDTPASAGPGSEDRPSDDLPSDDAPSDTAPQHRR